MTSGFLASVHQVFNNEALRAFFTKARVPLGAAGAAALLAWLGIRRDLYWIGLGISVVGALIQSWCFANLYKKKELACRGPYALVRNPMYLGRYLAFFGALLLTGNVWLLAGVTVFYGFYMVNRVKRRRRCWRRSSAPTTSAIAPGCAGSSRGSAPTRGIGSSAFVGISSS